MDAAAPPAPDAAPALPVMPFGHSLDADDDPIADIAVFIRSRYPLIFVDTTEEERAERLVAAAARGAGLPVFAWSRTRGLIDDTGKAVHADVRDQEKVLTLIEQRREPSVFVLLDFADDFRDEQVCRRLKDFGRMRRHTLFFIDSGVELPSELRTIAEVYPLARPDAKLLARHVRASFERFVERGQCTWELEDADFDDLVRALRGLTLSEVDRVVARLALGDGRITPEDVQEALRIKTDMLARTSALEVHSPTVVLDQVAGLDNFKRWAQTRRAAFLGEAPGLAAPRGFVLTGVPGCGKSLAVKALACTWTVPLLRLDAGALFDKWLGETERRLREALATAEALAPSILWIDEIEKGFAVTAPSSSDGGLGYRLVGTLATWMQERKATVLLAATSNDITLLPPELTRQGRFDEIFFVDLPNADQRRVMLQLLLRARSCTVEAFDLDALAERTEGFSGSELEQAVTNGLYAASVATGTLTHDLLVAEIEATRPLSQVAPEKVQRIRAWGEAHARPA